MFCSTPWTMFLSMLLCHCNSMVQQCLTIKLCDNLFDKVQERCWQQLTCLSYKRIFFDLATLNHHNVVVHLQMLNNIVKIMINNYDSLTMLFSYNNSILKTLISHCWCNSLCYSLLHKQCFVQLVFQRGIKPIVLRAGCSGILVIRLQSEVSHKKRLSSTVVI